MPVYGIEQPKQTAAYTKNTLGIDCESAIDLGGTVFQESCHLCSTMFGYQTWLKIKELDFEIRKLDHEDRKMDHEDRKMDHEEKKMDHEDRKMDHEYRMKQLDIEAKKTSHSIPISSNSEDDKAPDEEPIRKKPSWHFW